MSFLIPPEISNYQVTLNYFELQLHVQGKFEINTKFKFLPQTLFANFSLPAQQIENIELIPAQRESCSYLKYNCQVFKIDSYIKLLSDKYFSREFKDYERVPLNINFEFRTHNWSTFKSKNYPISFHSVDQATLVNHFKLLNIKTGFPYKNSFHIDRHKYESTYKTLDIPVGWTLIKNKQAQTHTKRVVLNLAANDDLEKPISKWFSVYDNKGLSVSVLEASYENNPATLFKTYSNKQTHFHSYPLSTQHKQGFLETKLSLSLEHARAQVWLRNHFSLKQKQLPKNRKIKIKIRPKYDDLFRKRKLFKYVDF